MGIAGVDIGFCELFRSDGSRKLCGRVGGKENRGEDRC